MSKKLSIIFYIILGAISAVLLLLTLLASFGNYSMEKSVWTFLSIALLAVTLAISVIIYIPKKSIYSIGFYLMHAGLVFFISGMLIYTFAGYSVLVEAPSVSSISADMSAEMQKNGVEIPNGYYNRIPAKDGGAADLGFNFRIADFKTEYYDEEKTEVSHYEATLAFLEGDSEIYTPLTVNHPIYKNGWKIYLMSVSQNGLYGYDEITLMFKRDPGEILSTTGIIISIIGAFAMCLPRKREAVRENG